MRKEFATRGNKSIVGQNSLMLIKGVSNELKCPQCSFDNRDGVPVLRGMWKQSRNRCSSCGAGVSRGEGSAVNAAASGRCICLFITGFFKPRSYTLPNLWTRFSLPRIRSKGNANWLRYCLPMWSTILLYQRSLIQKKIARLWMTALRF